MSLTEGVSEYNDFTVQWIQSKAVQQTSAPDNDNQRIQSLNVEPVAGELNMDQRAELVGYDLHVEAGWNGVDAESPLGIVAAMELGFHDDPAFIDFGSLVASDTISGLSPSDSDYETLDDGTFLGNDILDIRIMRGHSGESNATAGVGQGVQVDSIQLWRNLRREFGQGPIVHPLVDLNGFINSNVKGATGVTQEAYHLGKLYWEIFDEDEV